MLNNSQAIEVSLIRKYDVPGPRYTSYPTIPYWDQNTFSQKAWYKELSQIETAEISLYIHLPYCESLCTYCGCNTRITKNHEMELPYIQTLIKEWKNYKQHFDFVPEVKELHFGGGTPTFFSPNNLKNLIKELLVDNKSHPDISLEAHPNNTTEEHLHVLYHLGSRRLSFGIQDFDESVQKLINRIQPFQQVKEITEMARMIGFTSINYDLIYGLPGQSLQSVAQTVKQTLELKPDRIAFYSYAHVPWMKPAQKSYEQYLPDPDTKRSLYELGKQMLHDNGYFEVGMDHFALKEDDLAVAFHAGTMHRNFMGYTTRHTSTLIGLGASSISDSWSGFAQNEKNVDQYMEQINMYGTAVVRGHILDEKDLYVRQIILDLMCRFEADLSMFDPDQILATKKRLAPMILDGLVRWTADHRVKVLEKGIPFVRNICMVFDQRMLIYKPKTQVFSQTV